VWLLPLLTSFRGQPPSPCGSTGSAWTYKSGVAGILSTFTLLHRILIPLSLLIVLPVVSSTVFLSVGPSLIAVRFGSSFQLLSRGFSFRYDGEGGRWKREKEGEEGRRSGKARVADQTGLPCP
jgi:hypothetical protein